MRQRAKGRGAFGSMFSGGEFDLDELGVEDTADGGGESPKPRRQRDDGGRTPWRLGFQFDLQTSEVTVPNQALVGALILTVVLAIGLAMSYVWNSTPQVVEFANLRNAPQAEAEVQVEAAPEEEAPPVKPVAAQVSPPKKRKAAVTKAKVVPPPEPVADTDAVEPAPQPGSRRIKAASGQ